MRGSSRASETALAHGPDARGIRGRSAAGATLAILMAATAPLAPAAAQRAQGVRVGAGYVANSPELILGGAAYVLLPTAGGIGLYVDAKFDASSPSRKANYVADLSAQRVDSEIGDRFFDSRKSWRALDLALVRPVRPALMLYVGVGYATRRKYNEYVDPTGERGTAGRYWVEDTGGRASRANALAGMFFRMSRYFNAQFGVESSPVGATVGVSLALPPR